MIITQKIGDISTSIEIDINEINKFPPSIRLKVYALIIIHLGGSRE